MSIDGMVQSLAKGGTVFYKTGNEDQLRDTYVPAHLPHREKEIKNVLKVLAPAVNGEVPSHLIIYGKSGTGKTAVVRLVLKSLPNQAAPGVTITPLFVDCSRADTHFSVMNALVSTLVDLEAVPGAKRTGVKHGTNELYDTFTKLLEKRGGIALVALDEIGRAIRNSGEEMIFTLVNLNSSLRNSKIALIATTNDNLLSEQFAQPTSSRLNEERIHFPPYNQSQLLDILKARAREVFVDGAIDDPALAKCAVYAAQEHGDARRALAILRVAARVAGQESSQQITENHIDLARADLQRDMVLESILTLPVQQKAVLYAIALLTQHGKPPPESSAIYTTYMRIATQVGMSPLHQRSVRNYVSDFRSLAFIDTTLKNRGRGGGVKLEARLTVSPEVVIHSIEQDTMFEAFAKSRQMRL
jgi:cell division control protein 6